MYRNDLLIVGNITIYNSSLTFYYQLFLVHKGVGWAYAGCKRLSNGSFQRCRISSTPIILITSEKWKWGIIPPTKKNNVFFFGLCWALGRRQVFTPTLFVWGCLAPLFRSPKHHRQESFGDSVVLLMWMVWPQNGSIGIFPKTNDPNRTFFHNVFRGFQCFFFCMDFYRFFVLIRTHLFPINMTSYMLLRVLATQVHYHVHTLFEEHYDHYEALS